MSTPLLALWLVACGAPEAPEAPAATEAPAASAPLALPDLRQVPAKPEGLRAGDLAPDLGLPRVDAPGEWTLTRELQTEGRRGALVVFAASWCVACEASFPQLVTLAAAHPEVPIVVFATDHNPPGRAKLVSKLQAIGLQSPVVIAPPLVMGTWLGTNIAIPRYYFVGTDGVVQAVETGYDERIGALLTQHAARLAGNAG